MDKTTTTTTTSPGQPGNKQLPFLPGLSFTDPTKTKFHKSHIFDVRAGQKEIDYSKPGIGGEPLNEEQLLAATREKSVTNSAELLAKTASSAGIDLSNTNSSSSSYIPSWSADAPILRFEAWFKEDAPYLPEGYRIRRCLFAFHLEDDTLEISSLDYATGKPAGPLVSRHRIPQADNPDQHITAVDLNVGNELLIYAKSYHLYKCDYASKQLLSQYGIEVLDDEDLPEDPGVTPRGTGVVTKPTTPSKTVPTSISDPGALERKLALKQFLQNDRKVLRFFCVWDDASSPLGDFRKFRVHYFLADDTVEVTEEITEKTSSDIASTFLKRQSPPSGFPTLEKMLIGSTICVHSRNFLIYDVDGFTRQYYQEKYGVKEFIPILVDEPSKEPPKREVPPHTGFGSEEDSLNSCSSLVPKPPKVDWKKRMEISGKTLQFEAIFENPSPNDKDRHFVVAFFLADDTLSVFEKPLSDGFPGGKFLEKSKVRNTATGKNYTAEELFVGAKLVINGHKFILTDAAEWALRHMESNPKRWPQSDLEVVVSKVGKDPSKVKALSELLEQRKPVVTQLPGQRPASAQPNEPSTDLIAVEIVRKSMEEIGISLTPQEYLTLLRRFDLYDDNRCHIPSLIAHLEATDKRVTISK